MKQADRTCAVDGCDRPPKSRGWCSTHYGRWEKFGDPLLGAKNRHGFSHRPWPGHPGSVHQWITRTYPKTGRCEWCGATRQTHYASAEHRYTSNRADWFELCPRCHVNFDASATRRDQMLGVRRKRATLSLEQARVIRRLANEGWSYSQLGRRFGVHSQTIAALIQGRTWKEPNSP